MPAECSRQGMASVIKTWTYRPISDWVHRDTLGVSDYFDVAPEELETYTFQSAEDAACYQNGQETEQKCINYLVRNVTSLSINQDAIFKDSYTEADQVYIDLTLDALRLLKESVE